VIIIWRDLECIKADMNIYFGKKFPWAVRKTDIRKYEVGKMNSLPIGYVEQLGLEIFVLFANFWHTTKTKRGKMISVEEMEEFYEEILFGAIKLINSPENHIFPFQSICGYKPQMRLFPSKIQYL